MFLVYRSRTVGNVTVNCPAREYTVVVRKGRATMNKYGPKAQKKVEQTMHEFKEGDLKSGKSGKKVTNPKQAVAIGLSKARQAGAKVPKKRG